VDLEEVGPELGTGLFILLLQLSLSGRLPPFIEDSASSITDLAAK